LIYSGHDDPTIIKMLEDLTGVNALNIPLDDEQVLSLFNNTSALGVTPDDLMGLDLGKPWCAGVWYGI